MEFQLSTLQFFNLFFVLLLVISVSSHNNKEIVLENQHHRVFRDTVPNGNVNADTLDNKISNSLNTSTGISASKNASTVRTDLVVIKDKGIENVEHIFG